MHRAKLQTFCVYMMIAICNHCLMQTFTHRRPAIAHAPRPWLTRLKGVRAYPVGGQGMTTRSCCNPSGTALYCLRHARAMRGPAIPSVARASSVRSCASWRRADEPANVGAGARPVPPCSPAGGPPSGRATERGHLGSRRPGPGPVRQRRCRGHVRRGRSLWSRARRQDVALRPAAPPAVRLSPPLWTQFATSRTISHVSTAPTSAA